MISRDVISSSSPYGGTAPSVSVVVLTHNEQNNIGPCLESCAWCDDVHVLDSDSNDDTCQIAERAGASVHSNPFVDFGAQRNWAIDNIPCKHRWHFHLDADERFTHSLAAEMQRAIAGLEEAADEVAGFLVPSQMMLLDQWLKHTSNYPTYQVRLFDSRNCRFESHGHGQREVCDGELGMLQNPYVHYNYSHGFVHWLSRHNVYSSQESLLGESIRASQTPTAGQLLSRDQVTRRRALKTLSYYFWGRPFWRFFYSYLLRLGFLDRGAGFHYAAMISMYEYWIEVKIREDEDRWCVRTKELATRLLENGDKRGG